MLRVQRAAAGRGLDLKVVRLPDDKDPCDLLQEEGPDSFATRAGEAISFLEFQVESVMEGADVSSAAGKDRLVAELAPVFARRRPSAERDEQIRQVADRLDLSEHLLAPLLARPRRAAARRRAAGRASAARPRAASAGSGSSSRCASRAASAAASTSRASRTTTSPRTCCAARATWIARALRLADRRARRATTSSSRRPSARSSCAPRASRPASTRSRSASSGSSAAGSSARSSAAGEAEDFERQRELSLRAQPRSPSRSPG